LARVEAVALFLERARAVQPSMTLTNENAAAVAAICARLDGLPLAIELAAAHSKLLPPRALVGRLEHRLDVLVGGARDSPARHRTMSGAIAWSYDVLSEEEQAVFSRLGIFVGGFSADAAASVCGRDVLDVVGSLVDKNLVRVDEGVGGEARFRMLDTIRAYSLARLEARGDMADAGMLHAQWSLALAHLAEPELRGPQQALWMARLEQEHDNLQAALAWSLGCGQVELALALSGAVYMFWFTRGYFLEGQHWLERGLSLAEASEVSPAVRAKAQSAAGEMAWGRGDLDRARSYHEASLELRRKLADAAGMAQSLHNLGNLAIERGEYDTARSLHEEALTIRRELGMPRDLALSLRNVARLASGRGDSEGARAFLEEALRLSDESQHEVGRAEALRLLADLALRQHETDRAATLASEALRLGREVGAQGVIANSIEVLSLIAAARDQPHHVAQLLGAVEALRERMRMDARPTEQQYIAAAVADARSRLGAAEFATAWSAGRVMSLDEVEALAHDSGVADRPVHTSGLSAREEEVVALIAQGLTNRQIADRLVISERTTHAHVRNILDKLGLASRTQVATWAMQHDLGPQAEPG
jgi:non-specific serine/threonine protein kinase